MERKRVVAGNLRSIGYDEARRLLEVELANGDILEHPGVGREIARRLMASGSAWSFYRDNIEEEFPARRAGRGRPSGGAENPFE
jgi:hypothetical protein